MVRLEPQKLDPLEKSAEANVYNFYYNQIKAEAAKQYPGLPDTKLSEIANAELEKLKTGTFCIVENQDVKHIPLEIYPTTAITINAQHKEPMQVEEEALSEIKKTQPSSIITIRITGLLKGKPSEINWQRIQQAAQNAYILLKNTSQLISPETLEVKVPNKSIEEIEEAIITENPCKTILKSADEDKMLANELMHSLQQEKNEGERVVDFESRIILMGDEVMEERK